MLHFFRKPILSLLGAGLVLFVSCQAPSSSTEELDPYQGYVHKQISVPSTTSKSNAMDVDLYLGSVDYFFVADLDNDGKEDEFKVESSLDGKQITLTDVKANKKHIITVNDKGEIVGNLTGKNNCLRSAAQIALVEYILSAAAGSYLAAAAIAANPAVVTAFGIAAGASVVISWIICVLQEE